VLQTMLPVIRIECPEDAAFLAKADILPSRFVPTQPRSKSGLLGTGQFGLVPQERWHVRSKCQSLAALRPLDLPRFLNPTRGGGRRSRQLRRQFAVGSCILASLHVRGCGVVVAVRRRVCRAWIIAGGCQIAPPLYPPVCPPLSGTSKFSKESRVLPHRALPRCTKRGSGICGSVPELLRSTKRQCDRRADTAAAQLATTRD